MNIYTDAGMDLKQLRFRILVEFMEIYRGRYRIEITPARLESFVGVKIFTMFEMIIGSGT